MVRSTALTKSIVVSLIALLVALAVACSSSGSDSSGTPFTCWRSANACTCSNTPQTLKAGESIVSDCSSKTLGASWICTFDLDSAGQSSTCNCYEYTCAKQTNGSCTCYRPANVAESDVDGGSVAGCTPADAVTTANPNGYCCDSTGSAAGEICSCNATADTVTPDLCKGGTAVPSCSASPTIVAANHEAKGCEAVVYKAAPSASSSSSGASTAGTDCTKYDNENCNVCCKSDADCKCGTTCTAINSSDHECTIPCADDSDCANFSRGQCIHDGFGHFCH